MVWAYDAAGFEYDDWSPYAVYESDDVLVVRSEGDYFFALRTDAAQNRWEPLPIQSDDPEDLERLRTVVARLLDVVILYREHPENTAGRAADREALTYDEEDFRAYGGSDTIEDPGHDGSYVLYVRAGEEWLEIGDYDALWGFAQQLTTALLRSRNELGERPRPWPD